MNDAIEEIECAYNSAQRATKAKAVKKVMTEEEKAKALLDKQVEYALSHKTDKKVITAATFSKMMGDTIKHAFTTEDVKHIYASITNDAVERFIKGVPKQLKATTHTKRADGTEGANHQYYKHPPSAYVMNGDKPLTIKAEMGNEVLTCVPLKTTATLSTKGVYSFKELHDGEYMSVESVCKETNDDGLKQIYMKPMTFTQNPEWKGAGFCKCAVRNKKFNLFLRKKNPETGVYEKVDMEAPEMCCNGKVSANGKCKRHNGRNLKEQPKEWTGCGDGWTAIKC